MIMKNYILDKNEWETFLSNYEDILADAVKNQEHLNLIRILKDEKTHSRKYTFGGLFICYFSEAGEYLRCNSNLGTPAGVHHPDDNVILCSICDKDDAINFILDRIEIQEYTQNGEPC